MEATEKEQLTHIKEQMTLIYDGDPWYGSPIKPVLESVNPKYVFDSPGNGMHTIAELVAHMIAWRTFAEKRLRGETEYLPDQEQTFDWKKFSADKEHAWTNMTDRLDANQHHLLTLLNQCDDSLLQREVTGKPYTFHYLLTGILQHDLYHLGQIVYIQKLLGIEKQKQSKAGFLKYGYGVFSFENLALLK